MIAVLEKLPVVTIQEVIVGVVVILAIALLVLHTLNAPKES